MGNDMASPSRCPATTVACRQIVEQTRPRPHTRNKFKRRIMPSGHRRRGRSRRWKALDKSRRPRPAGYAVSGLFDLAPLLHLATNADFKLDAAEARRLSPLFWPLVRGKVLDAVVGGDELSEFLRHSRSVADGGASARRVKCYEAVPGLNHFTVCDPMTDADSDRRSGRSAAKKTRTNQRGDARDIVRIRC